MQAKLTHRMNKFLKKGKKEWIWELEREQLRAQAAQVPFQHPYHEGKIHTHENKEKMLSHCFSLLKESQVPTKHTLFYFNTKFHFL